MLTVVAGGLIFAAMTYLGIIVKNQYALRVKFLKYMLDFAGFMQREVTLYKTPISVVIGKFLSLKDNSKEKLLRGYLEHKDKSYMKIYELTDCIYLKRADRQIITDFLVNMGKGNYSEEKKFIEQFIKDLEGLKSDAALSLGKDGTLFGRLLALVGIALMIIVV